MKPLLRFRISPSINDLLDAGCAGARGNTMIDVIVSMAFVLLLLGLTQSWSRAVLYNQRTLESVANADQEATLALELVAHEIRVAGFDTGGAVRPLLAAGADFLQLAADLNGDGDTEDARERIRYAYRLDRKQMTRASGAGHPQPFVDDVPPDGLRFSFFDGSAGAIAAAPNVSEDDLRRVRRVDVRLSIEHANPDPRAITPVRGEARISVALRNR